MSETVRLLAERVRERVLADGVDLGREPAAADRIARDAVRRHVERAGGRVGLADEASLVRDVLAELTGYGALQPWFEDDTVEEIWINRPDAIYIARDGVAERTALTLTEREVRDLLDRMLASTGRRIDLSQPFVDASLPDGSRLHAVIPDIVRGHASVNIRKFSRRIRSLARLVELGALTEEAAGFLHGAVVAGANVLVSGATHTGKTTLLGALLASAARERIVTVEETFELDVDAPDLVAMQCRQPSLEGTGEVTLRRLVTESLRMRPDRLVVGEVRGAESLDLLIALNSGQPGMCTIHANSAADALAKLCTLPLLAGANVDGRFVVPTVARTLDLVVHLAIDRAGVRRVHEIVAPTGVHDDARVEADVLFERRGGALRYTGAEPARPDKLGLDRVGAVA